MGKQKGRRGRLDFWQGPFTFLFSFPQPLLPFAIAPQAVLISVGRHVMSAPVSQRAGTSAVGDAVPASGTEIKVQSVGAGGS